MQGDEEEGERTGTGSAPRTGTGEDEEEEVVTTTPSTPKSARPGYGRRRVKTVHHIMRMVSKAPSRNPTLSTHASSSTPNEVGGESKESGRSSWELDEEEEYEDEEYEGEGSESSYPGTDAPANTIPSEAFLQAVWFGHITAFPVDDPSFMSTDYFKYKVYTYIGV